MSTSLRLIVHSLGPIGIGLLIGGMLLLPLEGQAQINQEAPGMGGSPPAWGLPPSADENPDEASSSPWSREPVWSDDETDWGTNDNPWQRNNNWREEAPAMSNFEPESPPPAPIDGGLGLLLAAGAGYAAHRLRNRSEDSDDTASA